MSLLHPTAPVQRLCALLCGLLLSTTALADPPSAPNIPAAPDNSTVAQPTPPKRDAASPPDELPLPYAAWLGKGPEPPVDAPNAPRHLPLARAKEWRRRPLELTGALAMFLPSCRAGSVDERGCLTVAPSSGLELALLYRPGPYFAAGVEAVVSGFAAQRAGVRSSAGGDARFFGVTGRVYFAEDGRWDPYFGLTLGGGQVTLRGSEADAATSGFGGRVAGGIDYVFGSHLRLGPMAAFTHWLSFSEQTCASGSCRDERAAYGRLVGFATLGFRLTSAWGDVL